MHLGGFSLYIISPLKGNMCDLLKLRLLDVGFVFVFDMFWYEKDTLKVTYKNMQNIKIDVVNIVMDLGFYFIFHT